MPSKICRIRGTTHDIENKEMALKFAGHNCSRRSKGK
jgi:hypothetical protein